MTKLCCICGLKAQPHSELCSHHEVMRQATLSHLYGQEPESVHLYMDEASYGQKEESHEHGVCAAA